MLGTQDDAGCRPIPNVNADADAVADAWCAQSLRLLNILDGEQFNRLTK